MSVFPRRLFQQLIHLTIYREASRETGDSLKTSLKSQESCSNKLLSHFEKLTDSHFESIETQVLKNKKDDRTKVNFGGRLRTKTCSLTPSQYIAKAPTQHDATTGPEQSGLRKQFDCRPGCDCSCHVKRDFRSPWLINSFLGELSIHWRSQMSEVRCNCSGHKGLAIIYRFPQYLLQRYISMVLQTTYLDGPELLIRVPRVLPWNHLLWRYSICGDLMAIKRMFAGRVASPHDVDPAGRNALLHASKHESTELAVFLLDQGADDNQPDSLGRAPSERILKRSFGGMYSDRGTILRRILKGDDSFDEFGFTTLHKIVLGFVFKELQSVLDATVDTINSTDSLGRTALFWAVFCDHVQHVRILLSYGADPNAKDLRGYTPLDFVRGPVVCQILLSHGAEMNVNPKNYYRSSIHEHVLENGCTDVIDVFAAAGFNIDIKDNDDETPLLNAIHAGQTPVARRLVELGADINAVNKSSRDSALHFAAHFDRPEILKLLLAQNVDYTALECNGRNLAHCAARTAGAEFVKIIAGARLTGLDLELRDREGKMPGEYMESRIVMTDCEVGVHEAWEHFIASLPTPPSNVCAKEAKKVEKEGLDSRAREECGDRWEMPGAFPTMTG